MLVALSPACKKKELQFPAAPSGNGSTTDPLLRPDPVRSKDSPRRHVIVFEGTISRSPDGSEELVTDRGYRYPLKRMPGCIEVGKPAPKIQTTGDVIYSDCLEYALARLLVAQAIREKPNADNITLRKWLRMSGGQMTTEFRRWPDQDVAKMIDICRRVGSAKFISGDFPRPVRRQPVRKRKPSLHRRYRVRGSFRGRVFEARSIERV
jgi:hypothetical protein